MNLKEALETAVNDEAAARDKYIQLAHEAADPETRLMLEQIAREEANHLKLLNERLKALKLVL